MSKPKPKPRPRPVPLELLAKWFKPLNRQRPKLSEITRDMRPGETLIVRVLHEATCRHWSGDPCCCDPACVDRGGQAMEAKRYV